MPLRRPARRRPAMVVRRRLAAAGVVLLTATVVASCADDPHTNRVTNLTAGVTSREASVGVLNALVVSAQPGSGTLVALLVNDAPEAQDIKLESVEPAGETRLEAPGLRPVSIPAGQAVNLTVTSAPPIPSLSTRRCASCVKTIPSRPRSNRGTDSTADVPLGRLSRSGDRAPSPQPTSTTEAFVAGDAGTSGGWGESPPHPAIAAHTDQRRTEDTSTPIHAGARSAVSSPLSDEANGTATPGAPRGPRAARAPSTRRSANRHRRRRRLGFRCGGAPHGAGAGRRRSPATRSGHHLGRPPRNEGLRYPADRGHAAVRATPPSARRSRRTSRAK